MTHGDGSGSDSDSEGSKLFLLFAVRTDDITPTRERVARGGRLDRVEELVRGERVCVRRGEEPEVFGFMVAVRERDRGYEAKLEFLKRVEEREDECERVGLECVVGEDCQSITMVVSGCSGHRGRENTHKRTP